MFTATIIPIVTSTGLFLITGYIIKSFVDAFRHREGHDEFDVEETIHALEHERIRLMNPNFVRRLQSCQQ
jgi:hypothetical protein